MRKTLREIAKFIGGEIVGDADTVIMGVAGIKEAQEGDITFLANPKYSPLLKDTKASAVITSLDIKESPRPIIRAENPSLAFTKVVSLFAPDNIRHPKGIHKTAVIGKNVRLGENVSLDAYVVIADDAEIGDRVIIYAGSYVGTNTKIGKDSLIYSNVSIRENISIGQHVIIHSGTVIGSDGFGFVAVDGVHQKIPQTGTVEVQDDVEIGANVTVDRARFDKTVIGKGTKIDNLVQIAHNVIIGENSLIVAQVGISGSTKIGNGVILAGQVGVAGHITIGENAIVAAKSGVSKSIPANTMVFGIPAKPYSEAMRVNACLQRLPKLYELVHKLEKELEVLKKKGSATE